MDDLARAWNAVLARHTERSPAATGRALLAAWNETHRRYHSVSHLREILTHVEELHEYATDADAVRLAAWYHDAVYQGRPDDEELSARRAETDLAELGLPGPFIAEVGRLVRLTATHRPVPGDDNGEVLCDADLAALGAEPDRYRANTAAVHAEYTHVAAEVFRAARADTVRDLLALPALFHTPPARRRWESQARANLASELRQLHINT